MPTLVLHEPVQLEAGNARSTLFGAVVFGLWVWLNVFYF